MIRLEKIRGVSGDDSKHIDGLVGLAWRLGEHYGRSTWIDLRLGY